MLPARNGRGRLHYLDGLRAVAIALVVCFHAGLPGIPNAYLGVDVFFVISGFLITGQIYDGIIAGSFSILDYLARRVLRIAPALLLVIFATLIAACALPILPFDMKRIAMSTITSVGMVANWYFWTKADYFAPEAEREPLLHLWSLSVEGQFYLLAPIITLGLVLAARRLRVNFHSLGLIAAAAIATFSFGAAVGLAAKKPELFFLQRRCAAGSLRSAAPLLCCCAVVWCCPVRWRASASRSALWRLA